MLIVSSPLSLQLKLVILVRFYNLGVGLETSGCRCQEGFSSGADSEDRLRLLHEPGLIQSSSPRRKTARPWFIQQAPQTWNTHSIDLPFFQKMRGPWYLLGMRVHQTAFNNCQSVWDRRSKQDVVLNINSCRDVEFYFWWHQSFNSSRCMRMEERRVSFLHKR